MTLNYKQNNDYRGKYFIKKRIYMILIIKLKIREK